MSEPNMFLRPFCADRGDQQGCGDVVFAAEIDARQITHLNCVRLRHFLYDFLGGVLGLLPVVFLYKRLKTPPKKSYRECLRRTQIR